MHATEFIRWCERLKQEVNEPSRADWYAAQTAWMVFLLTHTVANLFVKDPPEPKLKIRDFILSFDIKDGDEEPKTKEGRIKQAVTEEKWTEERTLHSMAGWAAAMGRNLDGSPIMQKGKRKYPPNSKPIPDKVIVPPEHADKAVIRIKKIRKKK